MKLNRLTVRSMDGYRESQERWAVGSFAGSFFAHFAVHRDQLAAYIADCGQEHCWGGRLALAVGVCSC
jgi:hypothetical protein